MSKNPNDYDVLVFSDGSGYKDGYGGWATMACTPDKNIKLFRMAAVVGTTVDIAEMTGMLEGLSLAHDIALDIPKFYQYRITSGFEHPDKPKVLIYSDRENMVLSVKKVYDRSNSPDLWARFEHFEKVLDIDALHVERETDFPEFQFCDLSASTGRCIAKGYAENCKMPPIFLSFQ